MSKDQMQDVYPIEIEFVEGERPTAEKLNAIVGNIDTGFSNLSLVIGDPWDYQDHGSVGKLSPEYLVQTSTARIIGPSDYLSSMGGCWNSGSINITVQLYANKNQWELSYPLCKVITPLTPTATGGYFSPLTWGTDITVTSPVSSVLQTIKTSITEVKQDGDFYVDFYTGIITSYSISTETITLTVNNIHMLGTGVPWGTHDVIPTWSETVDLCTVTEITSPGEGISRYELALPTITKAARTSIAYELTGGIKPNNKRDARYNVVTPGYGGKHRLPYSVTSKSLAAETELPQGYFQLWSENLKRFVPLVTFLYKDENSLYLDTPENWLDNYGDKYRLITSGTSVAEILNYLTYTVRDDKHIGLTGRGATGNENMRYTPALSHDNLVNLYSIDTYTLSTSDKSRWQFTSSSYPTNPHPQYLHRAGYMSNDATGNTGNAMRGHLVFAGESPTFLLKTDSLLTSISKTYGVVFGGGSFDGTGANARLSLEGGYATTTWLTKPLQSTFRPPADKLFLGIHKTGASYGGTEWIGATTYTPWNSIPLYLRGRYNSTDLISGDTDYKGALLGFDLSQRNEANYIKLMPGHRSTLGDVENCPAKVSQSIHSPLAFTIGFYDNEDETENKYRRLAAEQVREFRFRGTPYLPNATNIRNSLGTLNDSSRNTNSTERYNSNATSYNLYGANKDTKQFLVGPANAWNFIPGRKIKVSSSGLNDGDYTISTVVKFLTSVLITVVETVQETKSYIPTYPLVKSWWGEYDSYFTSPGMAGVDFLNLYSNAIFFSDTGDGKTTSFTNFGKDYFDSGNATKTPTGLYYCPLGPLAPSSIGNPAFMFAIGPLGGTFTPRDAAVPLSFGDSHGFWYTGKGPINLWSIDTSAPTVPVDDITIVGKENNIVSSETTTISIGSLSLSITPEDEKTLNIYNLSSGGLINIGTSNGNVSISASASDTGSVNNKKIHLFTTNTGDDSKCMMQLSSGPTSKGLADVESYKNGISIRSDQDLLLLSASTITMYSNSHTTITSGNAITLTSDGHMYLDVTSDLNKIFVPHLISEPSNSTGKVVYWDPTYHYFYVK